MFARRYFAGHHFAPRYFPPAQATTTPPIVTQVGFGGRPPFARRPELFEEDEMLALAIMVVLLNE